MSMLSSKNPMKKLIWKIEKFKFAGLFITFTINNLFDWTMNINDFFHSLEKHLDNFHHKPYDSADEGLIYVGLNEKYSDFSDKDEKIYFVNYLCMIVSLDLKFYELNKSNYSRFKSIYKTPKFEYGLTNTYFFPNVIYSRFNVSISNQIFKDCFDNFYDFYSNSINQSDLEITFDTLLESMINDIDINSGIWGSEFCRLISQKLENKS